jgi:HEPN domain-containing protein
MAPDFRSLQLGLEWVRAADRQLELARAAAERRMANETVSLAAAAIERYLKGTLAAANQAFDYTHNIERLFGELEQDVQDAIQAFLTPRVRQQLSDGGTVGRYPGGPAYTVESAHTALVAVEAARSALSAIRPELFPADGGTE